MSKVLVGCAQMTWGSIPEEQILAETAQAGYDGSFPIWGVGDVPGLDVRETYARHGLRTAPVYLGAEYWDPDQLGTILERAALLSVFARATGCTELFVGCRLTPERNKIASRVGTQDALSTEGFKQI